MAVGWRRWEECWGCARSSDGCDWPIAGPPVGRTRGLRKRSCTAWLMIAAGYEDGNDADTLRRDAMFKLALDRLPSDEELCSQSVLGLDPGISRLENLPDVRALLRLGRALVAQYCGLFRQAPKRIVLGIDYTPAFAGACSSTACKAARRCAYSIAYMTITGY